MYKTFSLSAKDIEKKWYLIDAERLVVGRLAAYISVIIRGKFKPTYTPHLNDGDCVVVINADKVAFTGNKMKDKIYYRHTGYPGGLKKRSPKEYLDRGQGTEILRKAINGMFSNTPLTRQAQRHVYIYPSDVHPHEAQKPELVDFASFSKKNRR